MLSYCAELYDLNAALADFGRTANGRKLELYEQSYEMYQGFTIDLNYKTNMETDKEFGSFEHCCRAPQAALHYFLQHPLNFCLYFQAIV